MSGEVNIIKASTSIANRRNRKCVDRKRVSAYCRVSTDHEDQLNSYHSQVQYYTDLIEKNPKWTMAGIYADEGITGTQAYKREEFLKMIQACLEGEIDMVITKSISRFARNTLDTLKYVRMLKEKNIEVFFEDEKINTLSMDGELLLVVLSSVAQQEVENISANVKKGLAMKMSRGELVGKARAFGYNYSKETKQITINPEEAEIVKYIFQRYADGAGSHIIAKELESKGIKTLRGSQRWPESTILRMLKNEKYAGDLLQGKSFTLDPISKRRLENLGEVDQYYVKDHHEAIVSRELFDQVQYVMSKRRGNIHNPIVNPGEYRTLFSRKHSFSGIVQCGFCGGTYNRREWHSRSKYEKVLWICGRYARNGKSCCPNCKAIDDKALKSAFVESYNIITKEHKDVLQEFLERTERVLCNKNAIKENKKKEQELISLKAKLDNLLDMHLENRIDYDTYCQKKKEIENNINKLEKYIQTEIDVEKSQRDLQKRISSMERIIEKGHIIKEFDRQVFESIVDSVIVGGYDEDGNADPYKITFVYKTGIEDKKDSKEFKPQRMNASHRLPSLSQREESDLPTISSVDSTGCFKRL